MSHLDDYAEVMRKRYPDGWVRLIAEVKFGDEIEAEYASLVWRPSIGDYAVNLSITSHNPHLSATYQCQEGLTWKAAVELYTLCSTMLRDAWLTEKTNEGA